MKRTAELSKPHYKSETANRPESMKPATKAKVATVTAEPEELPTTAPISQEDVQVRAYLKWEAAGKLDGNDVDYWLEAEQELQGSK